MTTGARYTGKVKFFNDEKGYGFIKPDAGGDDVFAHRTNFTDGLEMLLIDQKVSYELAESRGKRGNGFKAVNVAVE